MSEIIQKPPGLSDTIYIKTCGEKVEEEEEKDECIICFEELYEDIELKCGHNFHLTCIIKFLLTKYEDYEKTLTMVFNFNCPMCRRKIFKKKIKSLLNVYINRINEKYINISSEIQDLKKQNRYTKMSIKFRNFFNMNVYLKEIFEFHKMEMKYENLCLEYNSLSSMKKILQEVKISLLYNII